MIIKKYIIFIIIFVACSQGLVYGDIVEIYTQATTSDEFVKISDVASVLTKDEERTEKINNLFLGQAPKLGESRLIEQSFIANRLSSFGFDTSNFIFAGADHVIISRVKADEKETVEKKTCQIKKRKIIEEPTTTNINDENNIQRLNVTGVEKRLIEMITLKAERKFENKIEIEVVSKATTQSLVNFPEDFSKVNFRFQEIKLGIVTVSAVYLEDGKIKDVTLRFEIKGYRKAMVAKREIEQKDLLTQYNVNLERLPIRQTDLNKGFEEELFNVTGCRANRDIKAGTIVTRNFVESIPEIEKGQPLNVFYKVGGLKLTFKNCRAAQQGRIGEIIMVEKEDKFGKTTFPAKVLSRFMAQILDQENQE